MKKDKNKLKHICLIKDLTNYYYYRGDKNVTIKFKSYLSSSI